MNRDPGPAASASGLQPPACSDGGARATAVLLAYYFFPSPEVGAKRMTALAEFLGTHGRPVTVVSAFYGVTSLDSGDGRFANLRLETISERQHWLIALLVRAKRLVLGRGAAAEASGPQRRAARGTVTPGRSWLAALHGIFFALVHLVDNTKGWSRSAARHLVRLGRREPAGLIIVSGPPMSPLYAAISAGRRLRVPVLVDLRDPLYYERGAEGASRVALDRWARRRLERYVIPRAAAVVTTSPGLRDLLRTRFPEARRRIVCITNGFDGEPKPAITQTNHRLTIVYAGSLYLQRDPFPFLSALERLIHTPGVDASRIEVEFAGECAQYRGVVLREWLAAREVGRIVRIHGRMGAAELDRLYARATVLLNFAERQPLQVPAKTFELLALGREVLMLCEPDSDTARVIGGVAGAVHALSSDSAQLQSTLHDLYQRHVVEGRLRAPTARDIQRFSRARHNQLFLGVIDDVARGAAALTGEYE
jgi:hypothetical protein